VTVRSLDGTYEKEYNATDIIGKIQEDELFSDPEQIKEKGGLEIYIKTHHFTLKDLSLFS